MITLYGIKNCDTVRKARRWLDQHQVNYRFHDLRADGLDEATLRKWVDTLGWDPLLNRRGTTWRTLSELQRQDLDPTKAMTLMLANPTLIKRPVLVRDRVILVGFSETDYSELCSS